MKISAIICEYNPLHFGHEYHISKTKELTNCDCLICVMSGNFVQRGAPSVLDKYTKAKHAIMAGADMVIELPPIFALSSAQYFANGAIKLLDAIGNIDYLSFGSESGDIFELLDALALTEKQLYKDNFRKNIDAGLSYPKACQLSYEQVSGKTSPLITPNNILASEYIKAIQKYANNIKPITIKRLGAGYHDTATANQPFSSATAIRAELENGNIPLDCMPYYVTEDIKNAPKIDMNCVFNLVADKLYNASDEFLQELYEGDEGLSNRLKSCCKISTDYNSLLENTHTKRYTKSKIARLICHAMLGHTKTMIDCALPIIPLAVGKNNKDLLSILPKQNFCNAINKDIEYSDFLYSLITKTAVGKKHIEFV